MRLFWAVLGLLGGLGLQVQEVGYTVDDINPALPIIRNIHHNSDTFASFKVMVSDACLMKWRGRKFFPT